MPRILFKELRYRILYLPFSLLAFELSFAVYNSYEYLEFGYFLFPVICCGMLFRYNKPGRRNWSRRDFSAYRSGQEWIPQKPKLRR